MTTFILRLTTYPRKTKTIPTHARMYDMHLHLRPTAIDIHMHALNDNKEPRSLRGRKTFKTIFHPNPNLNPNPNLTLTSTKGLGMVAVLGKTPDSCVVA